MTDHPTEAPAPDLDEAPGWVVLDPEGNVVDSGPVMQLAAVADLGEGGQE